MARNQGRKPSVRFSYKIDGRDQYGRQMWDVIDNMYPPKVLGWFPSEGEAIEYCRKMNRREQGKTEDGY